MNLTSEQLVELNIVQTRAVDDIRVFGLSFVLACFDIVSDVLLLF